MRTPNRFFLSAALLAGVLLSGTVHAQQQGSCTYTYNNLTRSFVKNCTVNMPMPPLTLEEQVALKQGRAKACVITASGIGKAATFSRACK
jgi:hypothetical protein